MVDHFSIYFLPNIVRTIKSVGARSTFETNVIYTQFKSGKPEKRGKLEGIQRY
jgi:hypothetical protein